MSIETPPGDAHPGVAEVPNRALIKFNRVRPMWWCFLAAQLGVVIALITILLI